MDWVLFYNLLILWKVIGGWIMRKFLSAVLTLVLLLNYLTFNVFADTTGVSGFVTRLYQQCLSREPDQPGLNYWINELNSKNYSGALVSENFIFSSEFSAKNVSDDQFLNIMYSTFFNRESDNSGKTYWANVLKSGFTRRFVLSSFVNSNEFQTLCSTYGIIPGNIVLSNIDKYPGVTAFVQRFYSKCLNRMPDDSGLKYWVDILVSKNNTAAALADGFTSSPEFISKNLSNADFIAILYRVFFDREPDDSGKAYWVNLLANGYSRRFVLAGFVSSQEFKNLCSSYGINSGFITGDVPVVKVTTVGLNKTSDDLILRLTDTLTASVAPADATNRSAAWQSSDNNVATVVNGIVTAVGAGTATITAVTEDGSKTAQCVVNVTNPVITSVDPVTDINVSNGTTLANLKSALPSVVKINLNNGTSPSVKVTWDTTSYNGNASDAVVYTFNGTMTLPAEVINSGNFKASVKVNVAKPTITAVNSVSDIKVSNGTTIDKVGLPANIKVTLSNGTTTTLNVTWDGGTPAYNGNTNKTYVFSGSLLLPANITNPGSMKASVNVIVAQPTIAAVDTVSNINVSVGTTLNKVALPASIKVTLNNGTTSTLSVSWDGGTPNYDGNTSNTYNFSGTLILAGGITNPNNLKASVKVFVGKTKPAAKLLFTFDDGWKDNFTIAAPILNAKGFKGTAYVCKEASTQSWGAVDYMNVSDLNTLYFTYGWDIGNHTVTHPNNGNVTDAATLAMLKQEYQDNQNWILSNGWTSGAYHVCYPSGMFSDPLIELLKGIGVKTGRATMDGIQTVPVSNFYKLPVQYVEGGNVSAVKSYIDKAVSTEATGILMIHKVENTAGSLVITTSDFQQMVDYASQYAVQDKLDVTTISEWYAEVK